GRCSVAYHCSRRESLSTKATACEGATRHDREHRHPPENIATRPTAPFAVFYRTGTGEGRLRLPRGGFACRSCAVRRNDIFPRVSDAFAVAVQRLNLCRGAVRHWPVEGSAIIDGTMHAVVLREGVMIFALDGVFDVAPFPV